jgi:carbamate kinase
VRVVVALGGNALLRRGEPMTIERQRANVRLAAEPLARLTREHQLVITHGNGPQVGLLALQAAAYSAVPGYPLDVLGAESEGMVGYLLEQELGNLLPVDQPLATILTQVEVDPADPAFERPSKPIGPVYTRAEAERAAADRGWPIAPDGTGWRRVVPSPRPRRIFEIRVIERLVDWGVIVICAGGGGIPTMYLPGEAPPDADRTLVGIEAVIDKDRAGALLAASLRADAFLMLTDVPGVELAWGTPGARRVARASPEALEAQSFEAGSMGPKVEAACAFVRETGRRAAIGALEDAVALLDGRAGTTVTREAQGIELYSEMA